MSTGYRGNTRLKTTGAKHEWSPELIAEYIKCKNDIIYFAEKYFKIVTEKGIHLIKLRDYQKEMILSMVNNRRTISNMSRQAGKTESFRVFLTHSILFNDYYSIGILANKEDTSIEILGKLQLSYQALPSWLQLGVIEWNKGSFVLENNSRIIASSTSSNSIRGYTFQCIVVDEAAHIENWEDFYSSVYPTISAGTNTKLIMVSTPNGLNHFYEFWQGATNKTNDFYPIFVPWNLVPGRDQRWKEETLKGMNNNLQKFQQEFGADFLGSSGTLIEGWKLKELILFAKLPSISTHKDKLKIFESPIKETKELHSDGKIVTYPSHSYVMVADVSRGKNLDYSAFSIINVSEFPYKQVCTYRDNQIAPADYAEIMYKTAIHYNNCPILCEINDIGEQIGHQLLFDFGYENVLCTESNGRAGKKITYYSKKCDKGIRTTKLVKGMGCGNLKLLIEQNKLLIFDKNTVDEFNTFSRVNDTYKAEPGKHDDLVMGLVLFAWLTEQDYFKELTSLNTGTSLREISSQKIDEEILPFKIMRDHNYSRQKGIFMEETPYTMDNAMVEIGKQVIFDNCLWTVGKY
jgi:hypothetical protein